MGIRQNEQKINLLSMTDFVLEQIKESTGLEKLGGVGIALSRINRYAKFLKQPLKLWMFVPCDENGNVLEYPDRENNKYDIYDRDYCFFNDGLFFNDLEQYQQAKERCLFLGQRGEVFDYEFARIFIDEFFNIDQLSNEIRNIQLTQTAIKQLGL